jgi:hypothetical protein
MQIKCDVCGLTHEHYGMLRLGGYRGYAESSESMTGALEICPDCADHAGILLRDERGYERIGLEELRSLLLAALQVEANRTVQK